MPFSTSGLLSPGRAFVGPRFAMWLLGINPSTGAAHKVTDLLVEDRQLLQQLGRASGPAQQPVGRLLLPLSAVPSPDQLCNSKLWVDNVDVDIEDQWANALQQPHCGFVALTVFKQPLRSGQAPPVSNVSSSIGTRLLLSNKHVNLWDFHVPPQTSCDLHQHLHPYVFINRTACETQGLDDKLQPEGPVTSFAAFEFRCVDVNDKDEHIHAFRNPGNVAVEQYIVEFKA
ncbi:hypothetical protein PHYBOEH_005636 [Phytophthora boehmeriae]|uniref:Uncharacterized protein n=1 Tax=Phytophthora boehmeriae TaxID=109152 RepID=A0A8T1WQC1_9STRA|nr:hypothetical protein PHYBOEH_005636 [Phytophthora boehmeriae]